MIKNRIGEAFATLRFESRRTLGSPGLLGLLLLGGAFALHAAIPPLQSVTASLLAGARQARAEKAQHPEAARKPVAAPSADHFPKLFPPLAQSSSDLAVIFAQATSAGLVLGAAQYQATVDPGGRFMRYQVVLPVKSQYAAIRRFIASVLNQLPYAALQEIHAERPAVDGALLDARIRLELIYRANQP